MIKVETTKTEIKIKIEGTSLDVMYELTEVISSVYGLLKKDIGADNAKSEIIHLTAIAIRAAEGEDDD